METKKEIQKSKVLVALLKKDCTQSNQLKSILQKITDPCLDVIKIFIGENEYLKNFMAKNEAPQLLLFIESEIVWEHFGIINEHQLISNINNVSSNFITLNHEN